MGVGVPATTTKYCQSCGVVIDAMAVVCPKCGVLQPLPVGVGVSERRRVPALILCFFLGVFGAHRFYAGKIWTGILQLLTAGGLGIWWMIDFIMLTVGSFRDADGKQISEWV